MPGTIEDRRIRSLRGAKAAVDPWGEPSAAIDQERRPGGRLDQALTVFLVGAECPFTCLFCDLWRHTLDSPTPPGALPRQLDLALRRHGGARLDRLKLYNASNFFDPRAVPPGDLVALGDAIAPFPAVTVESHARTIGPRTAEFATAIDGRLEVAIGLESIHPTVLPRLNKGMTVADFDRAAGFLADRDIDLRAFVLIGGPGLEAAEAVEWAVLTARHALGRGAGLVALIPIRVGNGALDELTARGEFHQPTLADLEEALDRCLPLGPGVVLADLWDVDRLVACPGCGPDRVARLTRINRTGQAEARIGCDVCGTR